MSKAHGKSFKITGEENRRGYLEDGARKPPRQFSCCAKCKMEGCVHEPSGNIQNHKDNKAIIKDWSKKNQHIEDFNAGDRDDTLMIDGKAQKKTLPPPKLKEELLVCKAWQKTHSMSGGYQCLDCRDRSCAMCRNMCRFVSSKR